jgi:hypothetical protein
VKTTFRLHIAGPPESPARQNRRPATLAGRQNRRPAKIAGPPKSPARQNRRPPKSQVSQDPGIILLDPGIILLDPGIILPGSWHYPAGQLVF